MSEALNSPLLWLTAGSAFLLVLSVWLICLLLWVFRRGASRKNIEDRLAFETRPGVGPPRVIRLWHEGKDVEAVVPGSLKRRSFVAELKKIRQDAGLETPIHVLLLGSIALTTLPSLLVILVTGRILAGLVVAAVLCVAQKMYVAHRIRTLNDLFENQLIEALDMASRSLRAGHPLLGAFQLIVQEMRPPVSRVFGEICQQQALGVTVEEAVRRTAQKLESPDLNLFTASLVIQLRTGGNLADMLELLGHVIRDRRRLFRRVRTLTAQTQLSKRVLVVVPFVLFVMLYVLNPDYLKPLYATSTGVILLLTAGALLGVGTWFMNRIAILRY